jgi:hypothetical protein
MNREQRIKEFHDFWFALIEKAFGKSPFNTVCTLLRPRAIHDAGWDVLDESEATFADFNWMLAKAEKEKGRSCARRLALHYFCFIIEMSPIHEIILNLLRCISGQQYLPFPFGDLYQRKNKDDPLVCNSTKHAEKDSENNGAGGNSRRKRIGQAHQTCFRRSYTQRNRPLRLHAYRI